LLAAGEDVTVDGVFGSDTKAAVRLPSLASDSVMMAVGRDTWR
jgi:hypothetical protein